MDGRICASCAAVLRPGRSEAILDWGKGEKLFFFSDIEGSWDRFVALMERNLHVFKVNKTEKLFPEQVWGLHDGWTIVFGGDSQDRGPGDIRFCLVMLMLKQRHPGRVHWVLGNRDGNKMRILYELSDSSLEERLKEINDFEKKGGKIEEWLPGPGFPWWIKDSVLESFKKNRKTPFGYMMASIGGVSFDLNDFRVGMMKWILAETMGAPNAFEERREELRILRGEDGRYVSDDDVAFSFVKSVTDDKKDGNYEFDKDWLYEYLSRAHIMLRIGDMVFCHGGITPMSVLQLPQNHMQMRKIQRSIKDTEFDKWVSELEIFYKGEITAFSRVSDGRFDPGFDPYHRYETRHGAGIVEYCAPYNAIPTSVVVNSYFEPNGSPATDFGPAWERVWSILRSAGIQYVFCGHRPRGDRGSVTGNKDGTVIVCSADNSHGGFKFSSVFTRDGDQNVHMSTKGVDHSLDKFGVNSVDGRAYTDVHLLLSESRRLQPLLDPGSFLVDILPKNKYLIYESKKGKVVPGEPNFSLKIRHEETPTQSKGKERGRERRRSSGRERSLSSVNPEKPPLGGWRTSFSKRGSPRGGAPVPAMEPQSTRPDSPTVRRRSRRSSKDGTRM